MSDKDDFDKVWLHLLMEKVVCSNQATYLKVITPKSITGWQKYIYIFVRKFFMY